MKTIEIDDDVYSALEKRIQGFSDTPNTVIRRLLAQNGVSSSKQILENEKETQDPFRELLTSPPYLMSNAGGRYLQILGYVFREQGKEKFTQLETYRSGSRIYFAQKPDIIERSGISTNPKQIPGTPFFALTNISNYMKRKIISDVLRTFQYPPKIIGAVVATLPDSAAPVTEQFVYPRKNT